ncbi:hypothetical protein [Rubritalea tangerina]|uniref:hypothetical protein n=1 Tax=Rubritalea tangerina TaxID=430798 RepID=UPI0036109042
MLASPHCRKSHTLSATIQRKSLHIYSLHWNRPKCALRDKRALSIQHRIKIRHKIVKAQSDLAELFTIHFPSKKACLFQMPSITHSHYEKNSSHWRRGLHCLSHKCRTPKR